MTTTFLIEIYIGYFLDKAILWVNRNIFSYLLPKEFIDFEFSEDDRLDNMESGGRVFRLPISIF